MLIMNTVGLDNKCITLPYGILWWQSHLKSGSQNIPQNENKYIKIQSIR